MTRILAALVILLAVVVALSQGSTAGTGDWLTALVIKTVLLLATALVLAVGAAVALARQDVTA